MFIPAQPQDTEEVTVPIRASAGPPESSVPRPPRADLFLQAINIYRVSVPGHKAESVMSGTDWFLCSWGSEGAGVRARLHGPWGASPGSQQIASSVVLGPLPSPQCVRVTWPGENGVSVKADFLTPPQSCSVGLFGVGGGQRSAFYTLLANPEMKVWQHAKPHSVLGAAWVMFQDGTFSPKPAPNSHIPAPLGGWGAGTPGAEGRVTQWVQVGGPGPDPTSQTPRFPTAAAELPGQLHPALLDLRDRLRRV